MPGGMLFYFASTEIAAHVDRGALRIQHLPDIFRVAFVEMVREFWDKRYAILVGMGLVFAMEWHATATPAVAALDAVKSSKEPTLWSSLNVLFAPGASALWAGAILQGRTLALGTLSYPLRRTFGLSDDALRLLTQQAVRINTRACLYLDGGQFLLLLGALTFMPLLAPLLLCLVPAVSYVAFREMFIDDRGNQTLAPEQKLQLSMEPH